MIKIEASPGRNIQLGYAGEDKVTKVIFPYNEAWLELGAGEFYIRVLRPGETEPYNAADVTNDSETMILTLIVTDVELSKEGYGQMQVVYIGAQAVKKSPIYRYRVSKAIDEPVDPPDGSIINEVVRSLAELTDEVGDISTALEAKADKTYVDEAISHVSIDADDTLSSTSKNPVQNRVITEHVNDLGASIEDMQIAVQNKADKSYVDTELAGKASTAVATSSANGLMSAQDKSRLDAVYVDYTSALTALGGGS